MSRFFEINDAFYKNQFFMYLKVNDLVKLLSASIFQNNKD